MKMNNTNKFSALLATVLISVIFGMVSLNGTKTANTTYKEVLSPQTFKFTIPTEQSPTVTTAPTQQAVPTDTPTQNTPNNQVFTCLDPVIGQPAPCVQSRLNAGVCVDVANGNAFSCRDAILK